MKLYNYIKGIAIFLLFLIPLLYLYNYCDIQESQTNKYSNILIKDKFLSEMDKFQEDLKPETYIKSAFQDMEKTFKFPDLNNTQFEYSFSEEDQPNFIDKDFIQKSKAFLKEKYGFEPFIIVSSGFDFTEMNIDDKNSIFADENKKNEFLKSCVQSILGSKILDIVTDNKVFNLKPCLSKSVNLFNKIYARYFFKEENGRQILVYSKDSIELQKARLISIFSKKLDQPQDCLCFFSNNFGNENIYQYYNIFLKNNKSYYNFLGLYYFLTKSTDININKIINFALHSSSTKFTHIKRNISNKVVNLPQWNFSGSEIKYNIPFPYYFYNFIEKQNTKNEELYKYFIQYLNNHSLELSIKKSHLKNIYSEYKNEIKIVIILLVILLFLYFINIQFNILKISHSLSLKVRFIVLIAVSVPIIGFWVIFGFLMNNEEKTYLSNIEKKISERINLLDKIREDVLNGFTFDLLEHKKILSEAFFKNIHDVFFQNYSKYSTKKINTNEMKKVKENINSFFKTSKNLPYKIISDFHLLDIDGKNIGFNEYDALGKSYDFKGFYNLYRFLYDINLLNLNSSENKKNHQQFIFLSSYLENYYNTYNSLNKLARESQLIPDDSVSSKDKVVYQLLASFKRPNVPEALVYNFVNMSNIMSFRVTKLIVEKYPKLLDQTIESTHVKYAIFERDASEIIERIPQGKTYPFWQMQLEVARKALRIGKSGSEILEKEDCYYYRIWRFYEDNPLVFVGVAKIPKAKRKILSKEIITLLLIIYCGFAIILISDVLSRALLEPIRTLSKFVKEIGIGHIKVEIDMKTGDELEKLGYSFNKMSEGLCEREKLKRFVSDKLFSSLEKTAEQKITQSKVTVLSSDIRSFTTISEKNSPEEVVCLLNDYFTLMEKAIVKYGGSIEKIVGDAISATFYEENSSEYSINACKAALEMRESLKKFNDERISKGLFSIENGIGLATGKVMIGFAGKKARRREFLLIGNIIKSAENLESLTKQAVSSKVFIDEQTFDKVKNNFKFCETNKESETFYREIML